MTHWKRALILTVMIFQIPLTLMPMVMVSLIRLKEVVMPMVTVFQITLIPIVTMTEFRMQKNQ